MRGYGTIVSETDGGCVGIGRRQWWQWRVAYPTIGGHIFNGLTNTTTTTMSLSLGMLSYLTMSQSPCISSMYSFANAAESSLETNTTSNLASSSFTSS